LALKNLRPVVEVAALRKIPRPEPYIDEKFARCNEKVTTTTIFAVLSLRIYNHSV